MKETKIKVCVEGTTPLLMNRYNDTSISDKSKKRTGGYQEKDIENKLWIYEGKAHIPSVYFRNSLVEASKQFKIVGKGKSTYSKIVGATVQVFPEMILIKPNEYIPFSIAAVNPMTKGRMMVTRPRFNKWSAEFEILLTDEGVDKNVIHDVLEQAGKYVGIGDWRPEKKGMFGKFNITTFLEVK